jgi:putative methyltransferase (TIGR04325 family)
MMVGLRHDLKRVLPPALLDELRRVSGGGIRFSGDHASWSDASRAATGYDSDDILRRVTDATRQVVAGKAAFERDSVLFAQPAYSYPILAALLRAAVLNQGCLRVIDFGGSLGSTYRQCRPFLQGLRQLQWCVVEQPHFVAAGQREFSTDELTFAGTLQAVPWWGQPCVVLLSSVLQYLEHPMQLLDTLADSGATGLVIDRTPLARAERDHLCVQSVPRQIYLASYPCRIFARAPLLARLARHWRLLSEFPCEEGSCATRERFRFEFVGLIYERAA